MYSLQFDGLIRQVKGGNGKDSKAGFICYGWLIFQDDVLVAKGHGGYARCRDATSNVSEYLALIEGLGALRDMGVFGETVTIRGDAKSVIDQMQGIASVNSLRMKPLHRRAQKLARGFINLIWQWTPRKLNKEADLLTRHALHAIRSNTENYLAAVQTIDPDNPLKLTKKERIDRSLLDLRVYRPLGLLA